MVFKIRFLVYFEMRESHIFIRQKMDQICKGFMGLLMSILDYTYPVINYVIRKRKVLKSQCQ